MGNTILPRITCGSLAVHPHVRGEYVSINTWPTWPCGSPPRAWGIRSANLSGARNLRFTPTCVGNTWQRYGWIGFIAVHPHVRGEYLASSFGTENFPGSPPRAWGIHVVITAVIRFIRFTPTCVGNTALFMDLGSETTVHPHVRGEYMYMGSYAAGMSGSPPRAWGIRISTRVVTWRCRFTPTCVGNTKASTATVQATSVHPHVRGEYLNRIHYWFPFFGSPPRAWGIRTSNIGDNPDGRFTPTCVGNTIQPHCASYSAAVHPHVRGEY